MEKTKSDSNSAIMILAICIMVGSYFLGYQVYTDKRAAVEEEIASLNVKYDQLIREQANKETYIEETEKLKEEYNDYLKKFATGISEEKSIMFTLEMEEAVGVKINAISMNEVSVESVGTVQEEQASDSLPGVYKLSSDIHLNMVSTYEQLKNLLSYLGKYPERITLGSLSSSYNLDTAMINSAVNLKLYAVAGDGIMPYIMPGISGSIGTKNVFDTNLVTPQEVEVQE